MFFILPVVGIIAFLYATLTTAAFRQWQNIRKVFRFASYAVFIFILLEISLLVTIGAKNTYIHLGDAYTFLHFFNFIFQSAAITNIAIHYLMKWIHWALIIILCTILCFICIIGTLFENVAIDESIVGFYSEKSFYHYSPEEVKDCSFN